MHRIQLDPVLFSSLVYRDRKKMKRLRLSRRVSVSRDAPKSEAASGAVLYLFIFRTPEQIVFLNHCRTQIPRMAFNYSRSRAIGNQQLGAITATIIFSRGGRGAGEARSSRVREGGCFGRFAIHDCPTKNEK